MSEPRDYSDLEKRLEDEREELKDCSRIFGEPSALDPITAQRIANTMFAAQEAIAELTKRCEEAEADSARLDWLDSANARLNAKYGTRYKWKVILNHNVARLMLGDMQVDLHDTDANGLPSCRLAIDEARAPSQRQLPSKPLPDDPANGDENAPGAEKR